jgi:antitoxin Phd
VVIIDTYTWPVQDAKARFSELLDACLAKGPQLVARRGVEVAVLVSVQEWRRLRSAARPSLKELLLSDDARAEAIAPPRGHGRRRQVEALKVSYMYLLDTSIVSELRRP